VQSIARNLSVPSPYFWDLISLPKMRYQEAVDYYRSVLEPMGYKLVRSDQGFDANGYSSTYFLVFMLPNGAANQTRIFIEFWEASGKYGPMILIYYVNPIYI
jgi:hypothetical protein